jgi:hypothetical protein
MLLVSFAISTPFYDNPDDAAALKQESKNISK